MTARQREAERLAEKIEPWLPSEWESTARRKLAALVRLAAADPDSVTLSREDAKEVAKCLHAAMLLASGYGKPETAHKFLAAREVVDAALAAPSCDVRDAGDEAGWR